MPAPRNTGIRALSRYRQVRVTFTQEASGSLSYAVYAKGLNDSWSEHTCLIRDRLDRAAEPILTTEDAIRALMAVLREQCLPGSVD